MKLASIVDHYYTAFKAKYAVRLLPAHLKALDAIMRCRTPLAGELQLRCMACDALLCQPRSCGHRSCPQCQHYEASRWLDRQQAKFIARGVFYADLYLAL